MSKQFLKIFGRSSDIAKSTISLLYSLLADPGKTRNKHFQEWRVKFNLFINENQQNDSELLNWVLRFQLRNKEKLEVFQLFFCIQTYFSIILKVLSVDILCIAHEGDFHRFSKTAAENKDALKCFRLLEQGYFFEKYKIANFFEGNLFSWYLDFWNEDLAIALCQLATKASNLSPEIATRSPDLACDFFNQLYQDLIPKKVRHNFGEYYTPGWLAEYLIQAAGYDGNPKKRILDPCCGSGTFLMKALSKVIEYARQTGETIDIIKLLNETHIAGFDINPIAVLTAKTNLIMFLAPYLRDSATSITLPVFLKDIILPGKCPFEEGFQFDFIVGNPPWVKWSNIPPQYRQLIQRTCKSYDLFSSQAWVGGIESDLSTVITFIAADRWLVKGGILAFLLPQVVFQTSSAEGFRKFQLSGKDYLKLQCVEDLKDIKPFKGVQHNSALVIAEKSSEPTTYPIPYRIWKKTINRIPVSQVNSLAAILCQIKINVFKAFPLEENQFKWLIALPSEIANFFMLKRLEGIKLHARKGITTDFNNIYWVQVINSLGNGRIIIQNGNCAKGHIIPPQKCLVEEDLLFPLARGTDVARFKVYPPRLAIIVPQRSMQGFNASIMQCQYPLALEYFKQYRDKACTGCRSSTACHKGLVHRSCYSKYLSALKEYWAIWNVGNYTFSTYKLVWREIGGYQFFAAVLEPIRLGPLQEKCIVPDHKLMMVPFENRLEAHFYCALLNSRLFRTFAESLTLGSSRGAQIFSSINFPRFDAKNEIKRRLAELSIEAHDGRMELTNEFEEKLENLTKQCLLSS